MRDAAEDGGVDREASTVRFLIEQQLRVIDDLDRHGLDGRAEHDLLRRLMWRDEDLRRAAAAEPLRLRRIPAV